MSEDHNALKKAYEMLSLPVVISAIILMALIGVTIYLIPMGLEEPNGGGWLLVFWILFAIVYLPSILAGILQVLFYAAGLKKYKQNDMKKMRTHGMICAVSSIVGNAYFVLCPLGLFLKEGAEKGFYPLRIIAFAFIIYEAVIVRILMKTKHATDV